MIRFVLQRVLLIIPTFLGAALLTFVLIHAIPGDPIQMMLGDLAMRIEIGRLLVMKAAWALDQGSFARKEVSMAKVHVANLLHAAADTAILACCRNASPASVTRTLRLVRAKSTCPSSRSSAAIWWLSADCVTKQRAAARVKLPVSATSTTYRIC